MSNIDSRRATILAGLVKSAREYARYDTAACAETLGLSVEAYEKVETGEHPIALPDLEVLAIYFKVPMGYFWGSAQLPKEKESYQEYITLRHRVIGVLLKQRRLRSRKSTEKLATELGISEDEIIEYETGNAAIPYLHLEQLSQVLDVPITHFLDEERGPFARHEALQRMLKQFSALDEELQVFYSKPGNERYFETAKKIGDMEVEKLRDLAASILDITF